MSKKWLMAIVGELMRIRKELHAIRELLEFGTDETDKRTSVRILKEGITITVHPARKGDKEKPDSCDCHNCHNDCKEKKSINNAERQQEGKSEDCGIL